MNTTLRPPLDNPQHDDALLRLAMLRESEIDLKTELDDLAIEIASRVDRVGVVIAMLRTVRHDIAAIVAVGRCA